LKKKRRRQFVAGVLLVVSLSIPAISCGSSSSATTATTTSSAATITQTTSPATSTTTTRNDTLTQTTTVTSGATTTGRPTLTSSVTEPFNIVVSFPEGAPPLNQIATLQCKVKSNYVPITGMRLHMVLPDALELVSGTLSWSGDIPLYNEVTVVDVKVKSIMLGNWTIDTVVPMLPNNGADNTGHYPIYISILENSAKWRVNPPFDAATSTTATQASHLPFEPVK
jgi:hypothetical protein